MSIHHDLSMYLLFQKQNWRFFSQSCLFPGRLNTLLGTNISPHQGIFEDDFPFPKVGYVSSLQGILPPMSLPDVPQNPISSTLISGPPRAIAVCARQSAGASPSGAWWSQKSPRQINGVFFPLDVSENGGFSPQIIHHLNGVFHDFHHPFWGKNSPIFGFPPPFGTGSASFEKGKGFIFRGKLSSKISRHNDSWVGIEDCVTIFSFSFESKMCKSWQWLLFVDDAGVRWCIWFHFLSTVSNYILTQVLSKINPLIPKPDLATQQRKPRWIVKIMRSWYLRGQKTWSCRKWPFGFFNLQFKKQGGGFNPIEKY